MLDAIDGIIHAREGSVRFNDDISTMIGFERISRRMLFLYGQIEDVGTYDEHVPDYAHLTATDITRIILDYNREDDLAEARHSKVEPNKPFVRKPIMLFIDSVGGDSGEGFALVDMIELSKTPVWTINIGEWSSMGFLIGITGHRRLSLRRSTFLWHDGSTGYFGSAGKVQDVADFNRTYEREVVRAHVLSHCNHEVFTDEFYDLHVREEFYMLPKNALHYGFIDEIIGDLSILWT